MHSKDPLAFVQPPSLILDNTSIKVLVRLHPTNITNAEQVVSALGQTQEWQELWSCHVFAVIQAHDREITDHRKTKLARKKASQKRVKKEKDQAKFSEISNEVTERIRQKVLSQYARAGGKAQTSREGSSTEVENRPICNSTRLQSS